LRKVTSAWIRLDNFPTPWMWEKRASFSESVVPTLSRSIINSFSTNSSSFSEFKRKFVESTWEHMLHTYLFVCLLPRNAKPIILLGSLQIGSLCCLVVSSLARRSLGLVYMVWGQPHYAHRIPVSSFNASKFTLNTSWIVIFRSLYHRLIFVYKLSRLSWHYTCPHSRLLQASYNNNNKMATTQATPNLQPVDREKIYIWINELTNPETRESALFELRYSI